MKPELEDRVQRAVELFMSGYGCCQSVVAAFADLYELTDEQAKLVAAGFGGGVGRMRMMCGAVSGLVVLAGMKEGQTRGDDREGKGRCYALVQQMAEAFRQENGALLCSELLGLKSQPQPPTPEARTPQYYAKRPCPQIVESAARIVVQQLLEKETTAEY